LKQKTIILSALLFIGLPGTASAGKWECGERSNLPIEGKSYCAAGDFRQASINLEKVLGKLIAHHVERFGDATDLLHAQRTFEQYRDAHCVAENKRVEDQPFHAMMLAQCKTRLTNLRLDEIQRMRQQHSKG
jgi:uncharacterized protein YecT (DUF1311 family)